jgi:hypothetical protein
MEPAGGGAGAAVARRRFRPVQARVRAALREAGLPRASPGLALLAFNLGRLRAGRLRGCGVGVARRRPTPAGRCPPGRRVLVYAMGTLAAYWCCQRAAAWLGAWAAGPRRDGVGVARLPQSEPLDLRSPLAKRRPPGSEGHAMAKAPATGRLTTWAADSESRVVEFVRSTLGPLALMLVTPPAAVVFWIVCNFEPFDGALVPLLGAEGWRAVARHFPRPTWDAVSVVLVFAAFEAALLRWLPGPTYLGPITPAGNRPRYKLNGVAAWIVSHAAFFGGSYGLGLFNAGIVYDEFGPMLITLVVFALLFCLFLYVKGRHAPTSEDRSVSGNVVWDYYWGIELHPELFGVNLKQLVNCRLSMMGWSLIVCSFAAKQAEIGDHVSNTMLVSAAITVVYLFKFFWWESGYSRPRHHARPSGSTSAGGCWPGCRRSTR